MLGFGGFTFQARGTFCLHWEKEEEEEVGKYTTTACPNIYDKLSVYAQNLLLRVFNILFL